MLRTLYIIAADKPVKHGVGVGRNGGYEVAFMALDGETIAVTSLADDQVRPIARHEIAHACSIARHGAVK